ncbi:MAG: PAS domain S-box protein [Chloroflexi bacterium]|nr:PAS domain S-box protein [Chloroflexota bacterium]
MAGTRLLSDARRSAALLARADATARAAPQVWRASLALLHAAPLAIVVSDGEGRVVYANPKVTKLFGYAAHELLQQPVELLLPERYREAHARHRAGFLRCAEARPMGAGRVLVGRRKGGAEFPIEVGLSFVEATDGPLVVSCIADVSRRGRTEEKLSRMNRLFGILSEINEVIARRERRHLLFSEACRIAVERRLFRLAWVGLVDPVAGTIQPAAYWGVEEDALASVRRFLDGMPKRRRVTEIAIRTGRPATCRWHAPDAGLCAAAAFPLRLGGSVVGALTMEAVGPHAFDEQEIAVLGRLAADLSFALEASSQEEELRFQEMLLKCESETSLDGLVVVANDHKILSFNRRFAELWGIPDKLLDARSGEAVLQHIVGKVADPQAFVVGRAFLDEHPDEELHDEVSLRDGRVLERYSAPLKSASGIHYGRVWYWRDVTERHQASERLRANRERLQALADENARLYEEIRGREQQVSFLLKEIIEAQEEERERICMEVHDGVAQTLTAAYRYLQALEARSGLADEVRAEITKASGLVRTAIREAREVVASLRPAALDTLGLVATLRHELRELSERTGLHVEFDAHLARFPKTVETALYRIVHEALSNVAKHARATCVVVRLKHHPDRLMAEIEDDGVGFDLIALERQPHRSGVGLLSMRKRAELLQGCFEVTSGPGEGTRVRVEVPIPQA